MSSREAREDDDIDRQAASVAWGDDVAAAEFAQLVMEDAEVVRARPPVLLAVAMSAASAAPIYIGIARPATGA